ncbi:MAG: hypothetical protein IKW93_06255 [Bacteroidales bacterium]|nr:hypothetical protein [Bacteroidales bacterium]
MKKILGIFRGFPGLGRVVSGVSLMETLNSEYQCETRIITYLQGNRYLESKGYHCFQEAIPMDYCSIGLLPTNKMGAFIHKTIRDFNPDIILIDGEPLLIQSIKISHKDVKIVALLNPADVENPSNDKEAMDYFNDLYSMADLAIIHGIRRIIPPPQYSNYISVGTILRREIFEITRKPDKNIYCLLGGGTVNVGHQFSESTVRIGELCLQVANQLSDYKMHIVCSSQNIFDALNENAIPKNAVIYNQVLDVSKCYTDACLIITRSGRNTLSELAFLGIPAISFISGCSYRHQEQKQNMDNISNANIAMASMNIKLDEYQQLCQNMINIGNVRSVFEYGNKKSLVSILSLIE